MSTLFAQKVPNSKKLRVDRQPYLEKLAQIADAPEIVYCIGNLPQSPQPTIAIVGSRKPTSYGREVTQQLASQLARRGVIIVSGLALGIDAIAHQAALDTGGITLALQANGLHTITPRSNRLLGEQIVEQGGALLSEYPPGSEAMKHTFLARNRLVSGIADAVIVTEAAARSGTLNTAGHALSQGRDVYAVPGNITSPLSAGCNHLIAQGATPITSVESFIEQFLPDTAEQQTLLPLGTTPTETAIIEALSQGMRDGDELLARAGCSPAEFSTAISMLEINGVIKPLGANRWGLA